MTHPEEEERASEGGREMNNLDARSFRAVAARANYLGLDRPDLQFASKELCREMAKPTEEA